MIVPILLLAGALSQPPTPTGAPQRGQQQQVPKNEPAVPSGPQGASTAPITIVVGDQGKPQSNRSEVQNHSAPDWWNVIPTCIIAGTTVLLWWVGDQQRRAMVKQAQYMRDSLAITRTAALASKKSARVAEKTLIHTARPFVSLGGYNIGHKSDPARPGKLIFSFSPVIKNDGPVPTRDMTLVDYAEVRDTPLPADFLFPYPVTAGPVLIGSHTTITAKTIYISDDLLTAVRDGTKYFYIWGKAEYRDWFDTTPPHRTTFCVRIEVESGDPLNPVTDPIHIAPSMHATYNYAD